MLEPIDVKRHLLFPKRSTSEAMLKHDLMPQNLRLFKQMNIAAREAKLVRSSPHCRYEVLTIPL